MVHPTFRFVDESFVRWDRQQYLKLTALRSTSSKLQKERGMNDWMIEWMVRSFELFYRMNEKWNSKSWYFLALLFLRAGRGTLKEEQRGVKESLKWRSIIRSKRGISGRFERAPTGQGSEVEEIATGSPNVVTLARATGFSKTDSPTSSLLRVLSAVLLFSIITPDYKQWTNYWMNK